MWLEKTDGLHYILIIYDKYLFRIEKDNKYEYISDITIDENTDKSISDESSLSILDCELYNNNYYVFDSCMINGEDISEKDYNYRMGKAYSLVNNINKHASNKSRLRSANGKFMKNNVSSSNLIIMKEYYKLNSWEEAIEFSKNTVSPKTKNKIDGVVL